MKYLKDEAEAIYEAYRAYDAALSKLQKECSHEVILQTAYADLSNRICENCGLEERLSGYRRNWKILPGRAYGVKDTQFYSTRPIKTYIPDESLQN